MGLASRTFSVAKSAMGVRAAIALSVALHGAAVVTIGARGLPRPPQTAPVDLHTDVLFVIADVAPEPPPPPLPTPPLPTPLLDSPAPRARRPAPAAAPAAPTAHATQPSNPTAPAPEQPAPAAQTPTLTTPDSDAPATGTLSAASAASGSGTSNTAPAAPPAPTAPTGDSADLAGYGRAVHAKIIASVRFPERAARERIEGVVLVEIVLDGRGNLIRSSVVGDAHDVLRDAALEAVARAAPFPAPPSSGTRQIAFQVPLRFFLKR